MADKYGEGRFLTIGKPLEHGSPEFLIDLAAVQLIGTCRGIEDKDGRTLKIHFNINGNFTDVVTILEKDAKEIFNRWKTARLEINKKGTPND